MSLSLRTICFVFACLGNVELLETQNSSPNPHPFLYFYERDVETLRLRAKTTHSVIAASIREAVRAIKREPERFLPPQKWEEFASHWNEQFGNNLCVLAIHCVLFKEDTEARVLAVKFMEIFASLPNWRVKASTRDDVPVAHSLVGMATAFDFLYSVLNNTQRQRYLEKIAAVTEEMYQRSEDKHVWWGKSYIQNHVATNYVALLTGALVVSRHYKDTAEPWKARAHVVLSRNMEILNYVIDGSMDEGAAYGSYTSRSLTQYVFLALRHFKVNLTNNAWLKEHFWFIYRTILPGFHQTVGIADSNINWFYGPESQLVFLESFVLKNGYGNWLASQIRKHRKGSLDKPSSQRNCMLHTEFLFYNASIPEIAPPAPNVPHLHVFSDWGVVTYGGGLPHFRDESVESTFLSFKCSVLHGRVVNTIVKSRSTVLPSLKGWKNFNPGHEHPDQGSFVFAPNGVPFITDSLYGPKYTWLNNALVFGPSNTSQCFSPDEGQIGECGQWFDYRKGPSWKALGDIVSASSEGGVVFMSGEMRKWYQPTLGLLGVYRCLVLLTPTVLLLVDTIDRRNDSTASYMRAFFHNTDNSFELERHVSGLPGAKVTLEGGDHVILWLNDNSIESETQVGTVQFKRKTNYVNITTPLTARHTRAVYLFAGPGDDIGALHVTSVGDQGVRVTLSLNGVKHTVSIATKPFEPYARYDFLGFGGFAKVKVDDKRTVRLGLDVLNSSRRSIYLADSSQSMANVTSPMLLSVVILIVFVFFFLQLERKIPLRGFWRGVLLILGLLWCVVSMATYSYFCSQGGCVWRQLAVSVKLPKFLSSVELPEVPPLVVYTSLPLAGAELGKHLFQDNTDFFHFNLSASYFDRAQRSSNVKNSSVFLNPCTLYERYHPSHKSVLISKWFRLVMKKITLPNLPKKSQKSLPAIRLEDPGWSLKFPWLRKVIYPRMRAVIIVRDPRAWVHACVRELRDVPRLRQTVEQMLADIRSFRCSETKASLLEPEFREVRNMLLKADKDTEFKLHRILAHVWATHMSAVLRLAKNVPREHLRFVRFEDLVTKPRRTAQRLYRFLGLSLPPAVEHKILQVSRTGKFSVGNSGEIISAKTTRAWITMERKDIQEINEICAPVMKKFDYKL